MNEVRAEVGDDVPAVTSDRAAPVIVEPNRASVERSPCDLLRLVVGLVALLVLFVVEWLFGNALAAFFRDLLRGLDALPHWLLQGLTAAVRLGATVLLVGGFVVTVLKGRWRFLLTVAAAAALAAAVIALVLLVSPASSSAVVTDIVVPGFPSAYGLAATVAALTAAAPWVSRGPRQWAWALVVGLTLVRFLMVPISFETPRAVLVGWVVGSATLLALGGPVRRPSAHAVADGLAAVGMPLRELHPAAVDARGSAPFLGTAADGRSLFVKALGDDERSADLMFRMFRRVRRYKFGDEPSFSTLRRAVEHEALVSLSAHSLGIRTPQFLALAKAEPNGFVLVYEAVAGHSLDGVEPGLFTDDLLKQVWEKLVELRAHGIAHRDLRLANLFRSDTGVIWIIDFGFSELAAAPLLLTTDVAELMASTATKVGAARAVAAARAAVGDDVVRSTLPRLKPALLSGATRTAMKHTPGLLHEVRSLAGAPS